MRNSRGEDFGCATYGVSSGQFPPGLSISDEGMISGMPTQAGTFSFYLTARYDRQPSCPFKSPSDDFFTISMNPGAPTTPTAPAAPTITVATASLPDANIDQPYTAPALTATGAPVNS